MPERSNIAQLREEIEKLSEEINNIKNNELAHIQQRIKKLESRRVDKNTLMKIIAAVGTLSVTTIASLRAIEVGIEYGFLPTMLGGAILFTFTLYWLWKASKSL